VISVLLVAENLVSHIDDGSRALDTQDQVGTTSIDPRRSSTHRWDIPSRTLATQLEAKFGLDLRLAALIVVRLNHWRFLFDTFVWGACDVPEVLAHVLKQRNNNRVDMMKASRAE
jgi:hypothetical protein